MNAFAALQTARGDVMPTLATQDLATWSGGTWTSHPGMETNGVCQDSRSILPGQLYVALRGERFDGHEFIQDAVRNGAVAALVEQGGETRVVNLPCLVVGDAHRALQDIAAGYRRTWEQEWTFGITGSVGKTTCTALLARLLETAGSTSRTLGNYNNHIGVPLSLLAADAEARFSVFEAGMNRPGEIAPLAELISPNAVVMMPVGCAHREQFESEEGIAHEKSELLKRVDPAGFSVLHRDLAWFDLLSAASPARIVSVALNGEADWTVAGTAKETDLLYRGQRMLTVRPSIPADFMIRNILVTVAAAHEAGIPLAPLRPVIEQFVPPGQRWKKQTLRGVEMIDDAYNANPLSMAAALAALEPEPEGRTWAVLGEMAELGEEAEEKHRALGAAFKNLPHHCLAVGPRAEWILDGAREAGVPEERLGYAADRESALHVLRARTSEGDQILLKASRSAGFEHIGTAWKQMEAN